MTLPPPLGRLAGTVLLGGALLVAGAVGTTDVARADVSISPRCEFRSDCVLAAVLAVYMTYPSCFTNMTAARLAE